MNTAKVDHKDNKKKWIALILFLLILIALSIALFFWQSTRLNQARFENQSPQVAIEHPSQGQTLQGGQISYVSVIATSKKTIHSLELWIDGQLVEIIKSTSDHGFNQIGRVFNYYVSPGVHTIVVQAIDAANLKGQSQPISITGSKKPDPENISVRVMYNPGMPIDQLGEEFQIDPDLIIERNPDIFGEGQPGEGPILIPVNPITEEGNENKPIQPSSVTTPPTQATGKICYPSQVIPAMTAFFLNTKTNTVISLPIQANQTSFTIDLYPGTYIAYAWAPAMSLGGSYSKAVPCGLDTTCTDHAPLPFNIQFGTTTQGIDICDWYHQPSVPNPPSSPGVPAPPTSGQISLPEGIPMLPVDKLEPAGNANSLPWAIFLPASVPTPPTNLKAAEKDCKIQLTWTSDPADVAEYQVWFSGQSGLLKLMASLKPPGPANTEHWYEFSSPGVGSVTIWVDAVNSIGGQSSNPASVSIPRSCTPIGNENLEFRTLEVDVPPGYDRVYAYLSLEGIPEQRLPSDDSEFILASGGRGNVSAFTKGEHKYILPLPKDEFLSVEGECWGWAGGNLQQLSKFSVDIPANKWAGGEGRLGSDQCSIGYEIQTNYTSGLNYETFTGKAGGIPAPFNVRVQRSKLADPGGGGVSDQDPFVYMYFYEREVYWQWDGVYKDISGFTILLNGTILKTVPAKERMTTVVLPTVCGLNNKWTVIAIGKNGKAPTSQPFIESIHPCSKYAKIKFGAVNFDKTCDHWPCHMKYIACDTLETYFTLSVNHIVKSFYGGSTFMPLDCGKHNIESLLTNPNDIYFVIPFEDGYMDFDIKADFWDYDLIGSNDYLGPGSFRFTWPSFKYGTSQLPHISPMGPFAQYWSSEPPTGGLYNSDVYGSRFRFNIYLYPNATQHNP